jgi:hypothetical protein
MRNITEWLRLHKYESHLIAFFFMVLPPVLMFFAAQQSAIGWIWGLIGLVVLGNVLVLLIH